MLTTKRRRLRPPAPPRARCTVGPVAVQAVLARLRRAEERAMQALGDNQLVRYTAAVSSTAHALAGDRVDQQVAVLELMRHHAVLEREWVTGALGELTRILRDATTDLRCLSVEAASLLGVEPPPDLQPPAVAAAEAPRRRAAPPPRIFGRDPFAFAMPTGAPGDDHPLASLYDIHSAVFRPTPTDGGDQAPMFLLLHSEMVLRELQRGGACVQRYTMHHAMALVGLGPLDIIATAADVDESFWRLLVCDPQTSLVARQQAPKLSVYAGCWETAEIGARGDPRLQPLPLGTVGCTTVLAALHGAYTAACGGTAQSWSVGYIRSAHSARDLVDVDARVRTCVGVHALHAYQLRAWPLPLLRLCMLHIRDRLLRGTLLLWQPRLLGLHDVLVRDAANPAAPQAMAAAIAGWVSAQGGDGGRWNARLLEVPPRPRTFQGWRPTDTAARWPAPTDILRDPPPAAELLLEVDHVHLARDCEAVYGPVGDDVVVHIGRRRDALLARMRAAAPVPPPPDDAQPMATDPGSTGTVTESQRNLLCAQHALRLTGRFAVGPAVQLGGATALRPRSITGHPAAPG